jgi:hypothetical protein
MIRRKFMQGIGAALFCLNTHLVPDLLTLPTRMMYRPEDIRTLVGGVLIEGYASGVIESFDFSNLDIRGTVVV